MDIDAPEAVVVACCQVAPALGDPAANRELAADAVSRAAAQGAAVVVLPELVSSGYVFESRAEAKASAEEADGETVTLLGAARRRPWGRRRGRLLRTRLRRPVQQRRTRRPRRATRRLPQGAPMGPGRASGSPRAARPLP